MNGRIGKLTCISMHAVGEWNSLTAGNRRFSSASCIVAVATACTVFAGCGFNRPTEHWESSDGLSHYESASTEIEYPDAAAPINEDVLSTAAPLNVVDETEINFRYVTLQEAVHSALMNSRILRDLGGAVLRSPDDIDSTFDVALQELDPRFGVAAALSEFDATVAASAFHDHNDRLLNNDFFGGGTRSLQQESSIIQSQLTKRAAAGTQLTFLNRTEYDENNAPGSKFPSAWTTWMDMEVRQPLGLGYGAEFNRIAGPSSSPSSINGVVLARLRTDVSLTEFETAVRDFVSDVENAYWDLYFAYRDLDAKVVARDTALQTWNRINALYLAERVGGEAEKEAQAREQYFRFQEEVQNALAGFLTERTRTSNGTAGGTFRATGGVMAAERRLRLLMGLMINDGELVRPSDEPILAQVTFNWDSVLVEALTRRSELRRQKWIIKQREQQLTAAKHFLKPELDVVGRYRWRGFGRDLLDQHSNQTADDNAWENLLEGNYQEWQLGFEFAVPLGRRHAHAGIEYAELQLTRDRELLGEQEREVVHALSNAVSDMNRAWAILETSGDRRLAAEEQLEAVTAAFGADKVTFDVLLEAQRRRFTADVNYYSALVAYTLAIRNVHFEKGSLLDYNEIHLTEDLWPMQAYSDAMQRRQQTHKADWVEGSIDRPKSVSAGLYQQDYSESSPSEWIGTEGAEPLPAGGGEPEYDEASLTGDQNSAETDSAGLPDVTDTGESQTRTAGEAESTFRNTSSAPPLVDVANEDLLSDDIAAEDLSDEIDLPEIPLEEIVVEEEVAAPSIEVIDEIELLPLDLPSDDVDADVIESDTAGEVIEIVPEIEDDVSDE